MTVTPKRLADIIHVLLVHDAADLGYLAFLFPRKRLKSIAGYLSGNFPGYIQADHRDLMISGIFKNFAICLPGKIPVVVINLFKTLIVDISRNPSIKGRLAFISEHFQTDSHLNAGFVQGPDDCQLGPMVLRIRVMLAYQHNAVFFKFYQDLGNQQFLFAVQVKQALIKVVLCGPAARCEHYNKRDDGYHLFHDIYFL